MTELSPQIIFQDNWLVAVNKPAGMPVHKSVLDRDTVAVLLQAVRDLVGTHVYPAHRLDRPTSGLVLFALDKTTASQLGQAFEQRKVHKQYLAVVRGWTDEEGTIDYSLSPPKDERNEASTSKPAITAYTRLAQTDLPVALKPHPSARYSLLQLMPHTGRRHQLRRHMKHISHPIIGDTTYGKGPHNRLFRDMFKCQRLLLHAWQLSFQHPIEQHRISLKADLDDSFGHVVEELDWQQSLDSLPEACHISQTGEKNES